MILQVQVYKSVRFLDVLVTWRVWSILISVQRQHLLFLGITVEEGYVTWSSCQFVCCKRFVIETPKQYSGTPPKSNQLLLGA